MDSQEIQTIFLSFSGYLEGIKNYLTTLDPVKYKSLTASLTKLKSTIDELKIDPKAHPFQWLHLARTALDAMTRIFAMLDFKVDWHTGEISKTTATKFISQWQDITLTYKIYTRDATARVAALVADLAPLVASATALQLQEEFHKYPLADDLYAVVMTQKLDESYKTGTQTEIINILETDKSHILGERKFVSPYLTLNLHPRHAPESITAVAARLERKAATLEELAREIAPLGLLVIYREQPVDFVAKLPGRVDAAAGLAESSVQPVLERLSVLEQKWNWKTTVWRRDATAFVCIECVGDYRLLSPWQSANAIVQRLAIQKVLNSQLGRPAAYYAEQDRCIALNQHARALGTKDPPATTADSFGLNRGKIVNAMIAALPKILKPQNFSDALESPAFWKAWQHTMLIIETKQVSTLLRMMVQLESQFKKDLLGRFKTDAPEDLHVWLETHLSKIFAGVLNKNADMFGMLAHKQNIIDEMTHLNMLADGRPMS